MAVVTSQAVTEKTRAAEKRAYVSHIYPHGEMVAYCGYVSNSKTRSKFDGPNPDDCVVCLELRKARRSA